LKPALRHSQRIAGWAGLIAAPTSWFAAQQLSLYLTGPDCRGRHWIAPVIGVVAALVALGFGFISFRSWREHATGSTASDQRAQFIAALGAFVAPLFALVAIWQVLAGFFYTGCEH
jgi:hypothetical protein